MKFSVGEQVVHPRHGVGYVADLEEKRFDPNESRTYYVVQIPGTTLWVPVDELHISGLRKLSTKSDLDQCRQVLQSAPLTLKPGRDLYVNLANKVKNGSIIVQCEVVRDLKAYSSRKPLYGPIAEFQGGVMDVLCEEWAVVENLSLSEATHEIDVLLKKGRAANNH